MKKKKKSLLQQHAEKPSLSFRKKIKKMLSQKSTREFLFIFITVFIITLAVTLQYKPLETHKAPGDAFYYYKNAKAFSQVWKSPFYYIPGLFFHTLSTRELYAIGFNYQSDFDSFFRAPAYNTFLSFWIFLFGGSEAAALLSQIFLFSLLLSLLFLAVRKFTKPYIAYIIVFLSLLYLSYYIIILQTMSELFQAVSIFVLIFYAHQIFTEQTKNRKRDYFFLAFFVILTIYSKMSNKFLWFLLIPALLFFELRKTWKNKKQLKKNLTIFLLSFFLMLGLTHHILSQGQPSVSNLGGWRNYYAGSCLYSDGFNINTAFHGPSFRSNIDKSSQPFWFNKYSEICKYAVIDIIKKHPISFASMTLKKMNLLLSHPPSNNENIFFLLRQRHYLNYYHLFILLIAAISFFYGSARYLYIKNIFLIFLFYLSLLFGLSNPDSRYFWPLIPFYFFFASIGLNFIIENKLYKKRLLYILLSVSAVLFFFFNKDIFYLLFSNFTVFYWTRLFLFIALSALFFFYILKYSRHNNKTILFYTNLAVILFILFLILPFIINNRETNHFPLRSHTILQKTILSEIPQNSQFFCAIDLQGNKDTEISLQFNHWKTNFPLSRSLFFCNSNLPQTEKDIQMPQWIYIPIKSDFIKTTNLIKISMNKGSIFSTLPQKKRKIPSLLYYKPNINNILYGPYSHKDCRVYMPFSSEAQQRKTFISSKPQKKDANIFLISKEQGSFYLPKKYSQLMSANIKYIALLNPLDKRLVFWSRTNPGKDYVVVHGNLYRYLAGELDRFHSGYHFY